MNTKYHNDKILEVNYDFNFRYPEYYSRTWSLPNGGYTGLVNTLIKDLPLAKLFKDGVRYLEYRAKNDTYHYIFFDELEDLKEIFCWTSRYGKKVKYMLRYCPYENNVFAIGYQKK